MDMHPDAKSLLEDYTREAARRSGLPEPARSEGRIELQSHLVESATAKAQADGAGQLGRGHVREAIAAIGSETEVDAAFFAGHRNVAQDAHWGRRVGATTLDMVVLAVATAILLLPFAGNLAPSATAEAGSYSCGGVTFWGVKLFWHEEYTGSTNPCAGTYLGQTVQSILFSVLALLYFGLMEGLQGRTLGKMALGLRTVTTQGQQAGVGRALGRNAVKAIPMLVVLDWLIGMVAFGAAHQRLSDQAAGTRVLKA